MGQRFTKTAVVLLGLAATTALSPAYAQTTPSASPPEAAPQPANGAASSSPPQSGIVVLVDPSMKPLTSSEKSASQSGKSTDRAAFFEAHLAALHAGLMLTSDQEKLWPALHQSIRMLSAIKSDGRQGGKAVLDPDSGDQTGSPSAESNQTDSLDPFEAVKAAGTLLLERGKALQSLADAAEPLYSSLAPDQKRRLPVLVRSFAPNNMKLRQFLALMTWDAEANKLEQMEEQSNAQQPGSRGGPQGWSQEDQEGASQAMRHGGHQGWRGRYREDDDEDASDAAPGSAPGDRQAQRGHVMSQQRTYGDTPYASDE